MNWNKARLTSRVRKAAVDYVRALSVNDAVTKRPSPRVTSKPIKPKAKPTAEDCNNSSGGYMVTCCKTCGQMLPPQPRFLLGRPSRARRAFGVTAVPVALLVVVLTPLLLTPLKEALDCLSGYPAWRWRIALGPEARPFGVLASQVALAYAADGEASAPCGKALPGALPQPRTPPETERSPLNRSDTMWIQEKLHDLAYFSGERDGVWDVASRNALHDFKIMNGLSADDRWDRETEQRLSLGQSIRADNTFIGRWASDIGQCRLGRDHGASIVITSRAAETGSTECDFHSVTRQIASRWRVTATCSAGRNSWSTNLQRTWSSCAATTASGTPFITSRLA
jgi:hypothetical protein